MGGGVAEWKEWGGLGEEEEWGRLFLSSLTYARGADMARKGRATLHREDSEGWPRLNLSPHPAFSGSQFAFEIGMTSCAIQAPSPSLFSHPQSPAPHLCHVVLECPPGSRVRWSSNRKVEEVRGCSSNVGQRFDKGQAAAVLRERRRVAYCRRCLCRQPPGPKRRELQAPST